MKTEYVSPRGIRVADNTLKSVVRELPELDSGTTREVFYLDNDAVLKIASGYVGLESNRIEAKVWEVTRSEHLVPVLAASPSGQWLVMKKVKPLSAYEIYTPKEIVLAKAEIADKFGIEIGDTSAFNCGLMDGKKVILDYAYARLPDEENENWLSSQDCDCPVCRAENDSEF